MEPYPDRSLRYSALNRVYLARDGALPRRPVDDGVEVRSLSSEGWSPTPTPTTTSANSSRVYLARDGALPRLARRHRVVGQSLSSEGWSPTPTLDRLRRDRRESI